jgi:hypothetical protein
MISFIIFIIHGFAFPVNVCTVYGGVCVGGGGGGGCEWLSKKHIVHICMIERRGFSFSGTVASPYSLNSDPNPRF